MASHSGRVCSACGKANGGCEPDSPRVLGPPTTLLFPHIHPLYPRTHSRKLRGVWLYTCVTCRGARVNISHVRQIKKGKNNLLSSYKISMKNMGEKKDRGKSVPAVCGGNCSFEAHQPPPRTYVWPSALSLSYLSLLFSFAGPSPPCPAPALIFLRALRIIKR
jgi:hypothetical protein